MSRADGDLARYQGTRRYRSYERFEYRPSKVFLVHSPSLPPLPFPSHFVSHPSTSFHSIGFIKHAGMHSPPASLNTRQPTPGFTDIVTAATTPIISSPEDRAHALRQHALTEYSCPPMSVEDPIRHSRYYDLEGSDSVIFLVRCPFCLLSFCTDGISFRSRKGSSFESSGPPSFGTRRH